jgi:hypothetical protein
MAVGGKTILVSELWIGKRLARLTGSSPRGRLHDKRPLVHHAGLLYIRPMVLWTQDKSLKATRGMLPATLHCRSPECKDWAQWLVSEVPDMRLNHPAWF